MNCGQSSASGYCALREKQKWSQDQLGKAAGLGGKYIGVIERAEKAASFEAIEKLAKAFKVECYELFVPINRRSDAVGSEIELLLKNEDRINVSAVQDFLRSLRMSVKKARQERLSSS